LKDDSRKSDHITAIRALRAMGAKAETAVPQLVDIYDNRSDIRLRVAAALAVDKIEGGTRLCNKLIQSANASNDEKTSTRIDQLINLEQEAVNQ
jgi:hypothetical protein